MPVSAAKGESSWKVKLLLGMLTNVLLLCGSEFAVRTVGWDRATEPAPLEWIGYDPATPFPLEPDEALFWRIRPSAPIPKTDEKINSQGFRGPEISGTKPAGVRRALCFGDSNTFGIGVLESQTYARRLERWLSACKDSRWEVANLGVPGYTAFQVLRLLELRALAWDPDIVILYCGAWNEFTPAMGQSDRAAAAELDRRARAKSSLSLEKLSLYRVIRGSLRVAAARSGAPQRADIAHNFEKALERPYGPRVSLEDFEETLQSILHICRQRAIPVVFVTPALASLYRSKYPDGDCYAGAVRSAAGAPGAHLAEVREKFASLGELDSPLFADPIHPSSAGHAVIAASLARVFVTLPLADAAQLDPKALEIPDPVDLFPALRTAAESIPTTRVFPIRRAVALRAPHQVAFSTPALPATAQLGIGFSLAEAADSKELQVSVAVRKGEREWKTVWSQALEAAPPILGREERHWIDLSEFAGDAVELRIEAQGVAPSIVWSAPELTVAGAR